MKARARGRVEEGPSVAHQLHGVADELLLDGQVLRRGAARAAWRALSHGCAGARATRLAGAPLFSGGASPWRTRQAPGWLRYAWLTRGESMLKEGEWFTSMSQGCSSESNMMSYLPGARAAKRPRTSQGQSVQGLGRALLRSNAAPRATDHASTILACLPDQPPPDSLPTTRNGPPAPHPRISKQEKPSLSGGSTER